MIDNTETTASPIATLGSSLNFELNILQDLLNKKPRLNAFDDITPQITGLLTQIEPLSEKVETTDELYVATLTKVIKLVSELTKNLQTSVDALNDALKKEELFTTLTATLVKISEASTEIDKKIKEIKAADPAEKPELTKSLKAAFIALKKHFFELQKMNIGINESKESDDNVILNDKQIAADYFLNCLATALFNEILSPKTETQAEKEKKPIFFTIRDNAGDLSEKIDKQLHEHLDKIIHQDTFQKMEANWRGLDGLLESTDWATDIKIDILDCTKQEIAEDLENNSMALINGDLFKKVYVAEYDQYGGLPYGGILGLYNFENDESDRTLLRNIGKLANASHAPFISSVGPAFFGCKDIVELAEIKQLDQHMLQPRFEKWQELRESDEAAYIGLTIPRFLMRQPYDKDNNSPGKNLDYKEKVSKHDDFLWCNASFLFAKNMIRSFSKSGWCQYIRGPKGGGKIEHLPRYEFNINGQKETKAPIELVIPDYRELAFADAGFIPLVYRKGSSDACFFSSKSIKKSKDFKDPLDTENSQLVTNLAYTFSITRIAHYIKCIMRDNIGSSADAAYINNVLQTWLSKYVTTVVNPDDLTLRYYPFKAAEVTTTHKEGMIGWYNSEITILPHIQFEGLNVELRMDVRI